MKCLILQIWQSSEGMDEDVHNSLKNSEIFNMQVNWAE